MLKKIELELARQSGIKENACIARALAIEKYNELAQEIQVNALEIEKANAAIQALTNLIAAKEPEQKEPEQE